MIKGNKEIGDKEVHERCYNPKGIDTYISTEKEEEENRINDASLCGVIGGLTRKLANSLRSRVRYRVANSEFLFIK